MRIYLMVTIILLSSIFMTTPKTVVQAAKMESIVAIVGDRAISASELHDRMNLIMRSTGMKPTKEVIMRLQNQVLDALIDEQVQQQEAQKLKLEVSPQEIRAGFEAIAQQNKIEPDKFEQMIKSSGINIKTMRDQIRAQILWQKVVQAKLRPQVMVSQNDIQNRIDMLERNIGKSQYLVSEIFLPVGNDSAKDADIKKLAQRLTQQIKENKSRFPAIARQFSKAAGAQQGGLIGWVQEGQMESTLNSALLTAEKGAVISALRGLNGYTILFVHDKRTITENLVPNPEQVEQARGTERLNRLQRRYLDDLRAATFVETRI